jgi:hypothetical protein
LNFEAFIIPNLLRISDADTAVCISFITPSTWSRLSPDLVPATPLSSHYRLLTPFLPVGGVYCFLFFREYLWF